MKEGDLQREIMIALSAAGHFVERINSGLLYTKDGRLVRVGVVGRADLSGFRASDAKAFFFEVKRPAGRISQQQLDFLAAMQKRGAIAAVVRSAEEALRLL